MANTKRTSISKIANDALPEFMIPARERERESREREREREREGLQMANLRLAMDAGFWDLNLSSGQTLEGTARSVPGEPAPPAVARASRTIRPLQLSFLRNAFPLGLIPSYSPTQHKDLGSFSIQSLLPGPSSNNWWVGLIGQFRPRRLIFNIKKEVTGRDELQMFAFKDVAKHILDKSLYALGLFSQVALTDDTSLLYNVERHGERKKHRSKAMIIHKLPNHDVTLEAAWPELFVDRNGTYWDVPSSVSLDIASLVSNSGLRYRFGIHRNSGFPEVLNSSSGDIPLSLMPGVCAKAAFSYEKSRDLWREKEEIEAKGRKKRDPVRLSTSSYDVRLKEPHAAISGIIGGTCAAWFGGSDMLDPSLKDLSDDRAASQSVSTKKRDPFSADLFGSLCYTIQHGKFKNDFNDLTRIDAHLDVYSASALVRGAGHLVSDIFKGKIEREVNPVASPRINLILQQQVAGPIVFRVDSRVSFTSASGSHIPYVEDVMYSLGYSLRMLQSGKIMAWFSPKRKEAMVELRFFEF